MPEPRAGPSWLTIAEAARTLGVTERAVRCRVQRGTLETRREVRGNRSRTLIRVEVTEHRAGPDSERFSEASGTDVAVLEERVARLEEMLAEVRRERDRALAAAGAITAEVRAERDRLLALVERLTAEPAPLSRRPWRFCCVGRP